MRKIFEVTNCDLKHWRSQNGTSNIGRGGARYSPMAFTEQGVALLSSVLNSQKAIDVNIQIIRIFTKLRKAFTDNTELRLAIEQIKRKTDNNTKNIEVVFQYLDELLEKSDKPKKEKKEPKPFTSQRKIGFKLRKSKS